MELQEDKTLYLLSNFTHQVINPLNGIIGTLDNILDGTVAADRAHQRLRRARGQLEQTISLIRNLVFFAQYTADYAKVKREKADKVCVIPQLLIEAAQFFQEQAQENGVGIEIHERWKQIAVKGNPDLIRQVFMNLFDNAVKYSEQNTTVDVQFWIQKTTSMVIVTIAGKSVGFLPNEDIFALGVRGAAAQDQTSSGTGLGLHVCKLIIENMFQGSITAEYSKESRMTTFTIRLPAAFLND